MAFEILLPALNELMETSLNKEDVINIEKIIKSNPNIVEHHHLRTRMIGGRAAIEVHLVFDKNISLYEAHEHATDIETEIRNQFGNTIITTHLEPKE